MIWRGLSDATVARACAGMLLIGMTTSPACALELNGHRLLESCSATEGEGYGFCLGFLTGVVDGLEFGAGVAALHLPKDKLDEAQFQALMRAALPYCLTPTASIGQIRDGLVAFLEQNEEIRFKDAQDLVILSLVANYPCPQ
jgi:hypothetical protein